jgi:dTDP-4-dehydrorhamnose reductase
MVKGYREIDEIMVENKILITGGSGKLGAELQKVFPGARAPSHYIMNILDTDQVDNIFDYLQPELVIHTAAMTDVRKCESDWQLANQVNVRGTCNIVNAANWIGAKLIYISTACVFDGENAPYDEGSKPMPKNYYAITKYVAENLVEQFSEDYLIIRTNFVANEPWPYPKAFTDRYGSYLFAGDVAHAIKELLDYEGIVHVCGDKKMSMYDLAKLTTNWVLPTTLDEYDGPPLTRDMTLTSKVIKPFKIGVF